MDNPNAPIDWSLTTWEGSRRAQLRRWCCLTLRERLQAVEEMADLAARHFAEMRAQGRFQDLSKTAGTGAAGAPRQQVGKPRSVTGVREQPGKHDAGTVTPNTHKPKKGKR